MHSPSCTNHHANRRHAYGRSAEQRRGSPEPKNTHTHTPEDRSIPCTDVQASHAKLTLATSGGHLAANPRAATAAQHPAVRLYSSTSTVPVRKQVYEVRVHTYRGGRVGVCAETPNGCPKIPS